MTLTQLNQTASGLEGNRSENYFGVALLFAPEFFPMTSDCGLKHRRHPCLRLCRMTEQRLERDRLEAHGLKLGLSAEETRKEWATIMNEATEVCTHRFRERAKLKRSPLKGRTPEVLNTKKNRKCLEEAVAEAFDFVKLCVENRLASQTTWRVPLPLSLPLFGPPTSPEATLERGKAST